MKFLAAFKVKCFKCVSLLRFTSSINIPYKACPQNVFPRFAHEIFCEFEMAYCTGLKFLNFPFSIYLYVTDELVNKKVLVDS